MRHVLVAVLLSSSAALAQASSVDQADLSRGVSLPPTGAALADEATAPSVNPAGLVLMGGSQLFYLHDRNLALNWINDGLFLAHDFGGLAIGFGEEWMRPSPEPHYRRTSWALAFGGERLSLGATLHLYSSSDPSLDALSGIDLGVLMRPAPFLSIGATVQNVDQRREGDLELGRRFDLGFGLRPSGTRYTIGGDYLFTDAAGLDDGVVQATLQVDLFQGFRLGAALAHGVGSGDDWRFQIALTADFPHGGITYAGGGTSDGADHVIALRISSEAYPSFIDKYSVPILDLHDLLEPSGGLGSLLGFTVEDPYIRLTRVFDRILRDPNVSGVVLKVEGLPGVGMGKAAELREDIQKLRAAGKKVVAVVLAADDPEYLAISASDRIETVPQAMLQVNGLSSSAIFVGGTMQKLGIHWDVARVGAYKNAPDALTRTDMSPEQEEAMKAFLATETTQFTDAVTHDRHLDKATLDAALGEGLLPPKDAKTHHLVDGVSSPEEIQEFASVWAHGMFDPTYLSTTPRKVSWGPRTKIAIIPVIGDIAGGKSRTTPVGGNIAGAETVVLGLKRAASDPDVAAIVLRIDSPGGDGLASDLIYREVLEAKQRKPVIASMGDLAASGGYYAAAGADSIYALPTTLTGSIGVFALKPAFRQLGEALGVNVQTMKDHPMADIFDLYRSWTPDQQKAMQRWVDAFYDDFITAVATSRKLSKDKVDAVARGRVWSGSDAISRGLVDHLGGLLAAIAEARRRAGIPEKADVQLVEFGPPHGLFASMGGEEGVLARMVSSLLPKRPDGFEKLARSLGLDPALLESAQVMARLPYDLTIR